MFYIVHWSFWLLLFGNCISDEHIYGTKKGLNFYANEVLNINQTVPKNYTIVFEYIGSAHSPFVDFCKIEIKAKSSATVNIDREKRRVTATVHITNATNVKANISLSGEAAKFQHSLDFLTFYHEHASKNAPSKSFTIIYVKNATAPVRRKPFSQNSIGSRQSGDELLYFESRNVTNVSRFPSWSFEYAGDNKNRITYVGFSFNSPTTIAFINTTFVMENEFNAVTYDMNAEHYVANYSVYGYKNFPSSLDVTYKKIVESKEICCLCSHYKKYPPSCGERTYT